MFIETATSDSTGTSTVIYSNLIVSGIGTFGGGTLVIQKRDIDGAWSTVPGSSNTDDFSIEIKNNRPAEFRFSLSGSTSPSIVVEFS